MGEDVIWWRRDPSRMQELQSALLQYPKLKLLKTGDAFSIQGEWDVFGESKYIRSYQIRIHIPDNYPQEVPRVFEIGDEIQKIPDRHINPDSSACLFSPPQRWEKWPPTLGMKEFLNGPVKEFFFSQAYFELEKKWPFGEWSHGDDGVIEYYLSKLGLTHKKQLKEFLQYLSYSHPMRQWKCPCDKKQRFKKCHWERFSKLKQVLPLHEWESLKKIL